MIWVLCSAGVSAASRLSELTEKGNNMCILTSVHTRICKHEFILTAQTRVHSTWIEYLRTQPVDQMAVDEMSKDLAHLMKIVDRFSKIGSETQLSPVNINEVVGDTVMYFRRRIPRNVTLDYNGLAIAPIRVSMNAALFEWVVENLMKNSLDALQGQGHIDVTVGESGDTVFVEVSDTGKGIAKSNWIRIFEPGYTTKTRGWGLGLSLSRRIIEEYHKGKIAVVRSEIGKGTTIRITLKRREGDE